MKKIEKNDPRMVSMDDFDHLVYLRVFEGCNLHCEHCFIPSNPKKMTMSDFERVPSQIASFAKPGSRVLLQWHGGEPTALGARNFRDAIEHITNNSGGVVFTHGIQTNLINYNEKWRDIYREYFDSSIGVSWDQDIRLTKKGEPESNAEFESIFWENMRKLQQDGIEPYMVITGTKIFFEKFKDPFKFFSFMEERGISRVHIERLTNTGYARENWSKIGLTNREYSEHIRRFSRAYHIYQNQTRKGKQPLAMSPFDGLFESVDRLINGESGGYGCLSGACDTRFHTIDASGYKHGCTALTSEYDNKNASSGNVIKIMNFDMARKMRQVSCFECQYKPICSSGCMATEKVDESGECSGGKIAFDAIYEIRSRK